MISKRKLQIPAPDGRKIQTSIFEPEGKPSYIVIINSATGVRRQVYYKFAAYLAHMGAAVITYDYRGIGDSRDRPIVQEPTTMQDWALKDAQAIFDFAHTEFGETPLSVLGHSFGGQIVGLIHGSDRIKNLVLVGAQNGYWKLFPKIHWPVLWTLWKVVIPLFTAIYNYFPSSKVGLGEDLPRSVALQWAEWCCNPDYFFPEVGRSLPDYYKKVKAKTLAYIISDDYFAPSEAVLKLCERYPNARMEAKLLTPKKLAVKEIGHFGIFRERMKVAVWDELAIHLLGRH